MGEVERPDYGPQNRGRTGQWGKWKGCVCSVEGCGKPVVCRGMCNPHYFKQKWASGHRPPSVNAAGHRKRHLKHRYGISVEEFDARLLAQGGVCAICRQPPGDNVRAHWGGKLCVDHDHATGRTRALLCNDCNLAVAYIKSVAAAIALAEYLLLHDGSSRTD